MDLFSFPLVCQLLVVVSADWSAVEGTLYRYQRTSSLQWGLVGAPITVVLGKKGMAWGRGMLSDQDGWIKKEGDNKSPAGVFFLGPAFGDALHQPCARRMPFLLITDDLECVDDPGSLHYNQFVYAHSIKKPDWNSSEKMKEIGPLYGLGLVIQHNCHPIQAGSGSAIFVHIWRHSGTGTAGCTAMAEPDLKEIVSWLDSKQHPCLVQLPIGEYMRKKTMWGLPEIPKL